MRCASALRSRPPIGLPDDAIRYGMDYGCFQPPSTIMLDRNLPFCDRPLDIPDLASTMCLYSAVHEVLHADDCVGGDVLQSATREHMLKDHRDKLDAGMRFIQSEGGNDCIRTTAELGIGTARTGLRENTEGGHVDFGGDFGVSIHFLHYLNPRGISSMYVGAGGTFEIAWFSMIEPQASGADRDTLVSGGLDVDLMLGWELMRASWAYFFLEGGLRLPAYVVQKEESYGSMTSWLPGVTLRLGIGF